MVGKSLKWLLLLVVLEWAMLFSFRALAYDVSACYRTLYGHWTLTYSQAMMVHEHMTRRVHRLGLD